MGTFLVFEHMRLPLQGEAEGLDARGYQADDYTDL